MAVSYDERGVACGTLSVRSKDGKATPCPKCGDTDPEHREMRNYSMMWHEGDIHCTNCGAFIRLFDAG